MLVVGFSRNVVRIGGAVGVNLDKGLSSKLDKSILYDMYFNINNELLLVGRNRPVNVNGSSYCITVDGKNNHLLGSVVNVIVEVSKK